MRTISRRGPSLAAQVRRIRELLAEFSRRRSLRDPIASSCEDLDLTPVQVHLVLWLGNDGPLTMGELARRVAVTEKTITGIVDRLERDRLVQRERDPADRRVVHVRLAPAGEGLHRRIDAEIGAKLTGFLALMDGPDRRELIRILEKLNARLAGTSGARAPGPSARPHPRRKGAEPAPALGLHPTHATRREDA
jgi:DNA-binding MarR family transcriptional regulator